MDPLTVYLALGTGVTVLDIGLTICFQKKKFAAVMKSLQEAFQEHLGPFGDQYRVPVVFVVVTFALSVCILAWPAVSGYALYQSIRK